MPNWKVKPWRSEAYKAFIRQLPCTVCRKTPAGNAHHVKAGGMGTKCGDDETVPLCGPFGHHDELHRIGKKSFEKKYYKDLLSVAKRLHEQYILDNSKK